MLKKDKLATLINISSNFNRFKTNIMLEIDFDYNIIGTIRNKI